MYTIHTANMHANNYIEPTTTSKSVKEIDKYSNAGIKKCAECTSNNVVAIEFSRRREQESSTSRIFVRLFVMDYKRQRVSANSVSLV